MSDKSPILHILVVGFHHKKGCQIEFSYPPLINGTEGKNECPSGWKYLPTLALPDGSHNYSDDTVFFNLPSLNDLSESIFGVSCYRQIPVEKLKIRTADLTRSTVQKSVCILSSYPIYGYIEVKLALIADAFFEQGDFSCNELLIKAFDNLNKCLLNDINPIKNINVGISLKEIVIKWRHKILLLFKLFLLQRKVVCFASPVRQMCTLILGISSLHPLLIEKGFKEVACVKTTRPMSPMPDFNIGENIENDIQEKDICSTFNNINKNEIKDNLLNDISDGFLTQQEHHENFNSNETDLGKNHDRNSLPRDASIDALASAMFHLSTVNPNLWHAPIPIFSNGNLCLPYLSLPYMDLLSDPSVLSYIIGTSNILFHQKKNLADIQIDVENGTIETNDQELRRQLVLTTEDLRFIDYIIRNVQNPKEDAEGTEKWIRNQFQGYFLALLKTSLNRDIIKDCDHFNGQFMQAWKQTKCFQEWLDINKDESFLDTIPIGHPFAGTLSVADMKLKIAQTMHNSESGRKLNQAVNTTSRAVGGALTQARGTFSNWWSSITASTTNPTLLNVTGIESLKENQNENNDIKSSSYVEVQRKENLQEETKITLNKEEEIIKKDGIIEIAKEADILDKNNQQKTHTIFTV